VEGFYTKFAGRVVEGRSKTPRAEAPGGTPKNKTTEAKHLKGGRASARPLQNLQSIRIYGTKNPHVQRRPMGHPKDKNWESKAMNEKGKSRTKRNIPSGRLDGMLWLGGR
jgi:hypothetical protein